MRLPSGSFTIEMRAVVAERHRRDGLAAAVRQHEGVLRSTLKIWKVM